MSTSTGSDPICCPEFDPQPWDDKIIEWDNKRFIKDKVCTLWYMPLNFGKAMKRLDQKVTAADAKVIDYLCLSDHTSGWNMDLYLAVDKEIPGTDNTTLSGKFYCRVYEGPFKEIGKWEKDFKEKAGAKGLKTGKLLMWYTTCPKCAKKYGKNYTAIFAKVE